MNFITSKLDGVSISEKATSEGFFSDDENEFNRGLYQYLVFAAENGDTKGIRLKADKQLRSWINDQDKSREQQKNSKMYGSKLTERIMVLDQVKFPWKISKAERWDANYQCLLTFHEKNGHCRVPRSNPLIGEWVNNLRRLKKQHDEGINNRLTEERVQKLDALEFEWILR
jgi:hypothetical protein